MDELLDRAGAAFLAGDAGLARGVYGMLLEAISHDDAESGLPGTGTLKMLTCGDLGEAKARYLRLVPQGAAVGRRRVPTAVSAGSPVGGYPAADRRVRAHDRAGARC